MVRFMKHNTFNKFHLWEAALFLAFGLTLMAGVWASASENALAGQVLRLHVVANSDSDRDQALKLLVRDAVLAQAGRFLDGASDRQSAEQALALHLDELTLTAAEAQRREYHAPPVAAPALADGHPQGAVLASGQGKAVILLGREPLVGEGHRHSVPTALCQQYLFR